MSGDPDFIWMGETQREALASLRHGFFENKGFFLITGEIGTGKTTLINNLVRTLGEEVIIARVHETRIENFDFVNFISHAMKLEEDFKSRSKFLIHFSKFLNDACADDNMVLLIIDEGPRLKGLLQKILLSKTDKPDKKLPNIFLLEQNEHNTIDLDHRGSPPQQTSINNSIQLFKAHKTGEIIRHRLRVAGAEYDIYSSGPILAVHAISDGAPRMSCEQCDATTGFVNEAQTITAEIVENCDTLNGRTRTGSNETAAPGAHDSLLNRDISPVSIWLKGVSLGVFLAVAFFAAYALQTRYGREISQDAGGYAPKTNQDLQKSDEQLSNTARETSGDPRSPAQNDSNSVNSLKIKEEAALRALNLTSTQALPPSDKREYPAVRVDREPTSPSNNASAISTANPQVGSPAYTGMKATRKETVFSPQEYIKTQTGLTTEKDQDFHKISETGSFQTEQIRIQKVSVIEGQLNKEEKPQPAQPLDKIQKAPLQSDREAEKGEGTIFRKAAETNPEVDTPVSSSDRDASLATVDTMRKMVSRPPVSVIEGDNHQIRARRAESKDILKAVSQMLENSGNSVESSRAAITNSSNLKNAAPSTEDKPDSSIDHAANQFEEEHSTQKDIARPPANEVDATEIIDHILIKRVK